MLHYCNDPVDKEKGDDDLYQAFAVMGIALVAMGEDVGAEMALRTFSNLVSGHLRTLSIRVLITVVLDALRGSHNQTFSSSRLGSPERLEPASRTD